MTNSKVFFTCLLNGKIASMYVRFTAMALQPMIVGLDPGANPTIASYNDSVVKFYNATGSLARFENKNIIFYF
jgi:hypothetical protein